MSFEKELEKLLVTTKESEGESDYSRELRNAVMYIYGLSKVLDKDLNFFEYLHDAVTIGAQYKVGKERLTKLILET